MKKLLLSMSLVIMPFTLFSQIVETDWKDYRSNDCLDNLMQFKIITSQNTVNYLFKNKTDKWIGFRLYDDRGYWSNVGVGPNTTGGKDFQSKNKNRKLEIFQPSYDGKPCEDGIENTKSSSSKTPNNQTTNNSDNTSEVAGEVVDGIISIITPKKLKKKVDGNASKMYKLGELYEKQGDLYGNQAENYKLALQYYNDAAEKGYAAAQSNLGEMYYNGKGVAKNYNKALMWYKKAAEQENEEAIKNLKRLCEKGYKDACSN